MSDEGPPLSDAFLDDADAAALAECIAAGGVAVIPTDTVYGLACDPCDAAAVDRLYALKGRPPRKPSAVLFFGVEQAMESLSDLPPRMARAAWKLLPGPVTLLLPNPARRFPLACEPAGAPGVGRATPDAAQATPYAEQVAPDAEQVAPDAEQVAPDAEQAALGVRVPDWPSPIAALARIQNVAMQSSANVSGGSDPRSLEEVPASIRSGADLVLDGGPLAGTPSTVIDLSAYELDGTWKIVRAGALPPEAVQRALATPAPR